MLFKNITILDENFEIKTGMYVGIEGDKIECISDKMPEKDYGRVYEGEGKLLMSGFFNSHAHSPMMLMRGYGENMVLQDWLNKRIFPFEDQLDSDAVYYATLLAMAESLQFGIVSSTDMYYFIDDMVKAVLESGAKANISRSIVNFTGAELMEMDSAKEMVRTFKAYHGAGDGRIRMDLSIHAEYTSDEKTVKELAKICKEFGANMHVHACETELETRECKERRGGRTPIKYFEDCGIFDVPTTVAHAVWLEDGDYEILKKHDVIVASNPVSNLKLASGVANVPRMLKEGIMVGIGTDSVASNNSLNFFEEMKVFAMASKMMYKDPTAVTPKETLMAATVNGARGQGRFDTGLMKEGFKADLIVVDVDKPHMYPVHNLLNNLVYSASGNDVVMTMVDGKVLYEDGKFTTIDIKKVVAEVEKSKEAILKRLEAKNN